MKAFRYIIAVMAAVVVITGLSSCRKMSHNGKLDGQWQIQTIETIGEDGETSVTTPYPKRYYCLNLHVVNLKITDEPETISGNMHYNKDASTVAMDFPYADNDEGKVKLAAFGIHDNPVTFDIVKLDGKEMVLKSPQSVVRMRRF